MPGPAFEPLWDIVEEHLDEAEFLWERWEHSLVAPHYTLHEVARGPESRLLAHVDGLVANGPQVASRLLLPTLASPDAAPTRVRAAALALTQCTEGDGLDAVVRAVHDHPSQRAELARALECCEHAELTTRLRPLLGEADAELRHTAARVLTYHGDALAEVVPLLLASDRAVDRRLGLRVAARVSSDRRVARELVAALGSADPALRDEALTTGAVLGLSEAWGKARDLLASGDPTAARALLLLALRGDPADRTTLLAAPSLAPLRGAALVALGHLGTDAAVEAALPWLTDADHGRVAGEVVAAVTGVDLERERLTRPPQEADAALELLPEASLPLPDPVAVLEWWRRNRPRFKPGARWIAGAPRTAATLRAALHDGSMRRRAGHLLGLQIDGRSGVWHIELTAPSERQRRMLAALGA